MNCGRSFYACAICFMLNHYNKFCFSLSKADAMAEKIGYPPFILNNTALDKTYDAVCCETNRCLNTFKL